MLKKFILLIVALACALMPAWAARIAPVPVTGHVVDEQNRDVPYATIVLLRGSEQAAGQATDASGRFELQAPQGKYTLSVQFIGYEPVQRPVQIDQATDLGDIRLRNATTEIEGVVVTGQLIRREADRFVVDVANAPSAIGKDGIELLELSPGVWVDNEKITINGKSGSKVYINDRELRLPADQLLTYLRSLRAEQIQKIEVVPITGADYDADSSGGAIRITLKKRRDNGTNGSLSMNTQHGNVTHRYKPNGHLNFHTGRFDIYLSAWSNFDRDRIISDERTDYTAQNSQLTAHSELPERKRGLGGNIGSIYEIAPRHSIGAEFEYWHLHQTTPNDSYTDFQSEAELTHTQSRYEQLTIHENYAATFNYIWKLDSLGSKLKVLADYTHRRADTSNDNFSRSVSPQQIVDSVFRDQAASRYDIATATLALEKNFSPRWSLKAGMKYTHNRMDNEALYEYLKTDEWHRNEAQSFAIDYTERIAAAYGIVSAKLGRWSLVAGLRGEYTHTSGKQVGQQYSSLFPNANISYALTKDGAYSLIAQYARTISRPNFWRLSPQRMQISNYTYEMGNPLLEPGYSHDTSLTLVMKHKYTLTAGMTVNTDEIEQILQSDAENPDMLCLTWINYDRTTNYYVSTNLPFQPTKWWQMNVNAFYGRMGQRESADAALRYQNIVRATTSMTFTLPAKFYIDLSYHYQGRVELGNIKINPLHFLNAGVKKRFGEHFTLSFRVRNIVENTQHILTRNEGFVRRMAIIQPFVSRSWQFGLTYNFRSGKAFKQKSVEAGSEQEKNRL